MALSITDVNALLQSAWSSSNTPEALDDNFPLFKEFKKRGNVGAKDYRMSVYHAMAPRVSSVDSADAATIYAFPESPPAVEFVLSEFKGYQGFSALSGKALVAMTSGNIDKRSVKAMIEPVNAQTTQVCKTLDKNVAIMLTRDGTGTFGKIDASTTLGSTVLVLANPSDQFNFYATQRLALAATAGAAPRTGSITVAKIPGDGTLVLTGNITAGVAAAAAGDCVVPMGYDQTKALPGLGYWAPASSTKGTIAGVNVDTAGNVLKLAGYFFDASTGNFTIDGAISRALADFTANSGEATLIALHPTDYEELNQCGSTAVTVDQGGSRIFGFDALLFMSNGKKIKTIPCRSVEAGTVWALDTSKFELLFAGQPVSAPEERDGLMIRKPTASADAWEIECKVYPWGVVLAEGCVPGESLLRIKLR